MSKTNSDLVDQISKIIRKNKDNITALLDAGSGNSGDTSSFCKKEQESYVNPETGEEVDYEIIFSMSYRDEEPHKFQRLKTE